MSKRKKEPKQESPEEMRRKFLIGFVIVSVALVLVVLGFTYVMPRVIRIFTGEKTFAGHPTSYWTTALAGKSKQLPWPDAAKTLRSAGEKAVPVLTQVLKSDENLARARAARTLALIGSKEAVPALNDAQKDPDRDVRLWSTYALAVIAPEGGQASIPSMLEAALLQDKDINIAENIDKALEKFPVETRVAGLIEANKHPVMEVRFKAVEELSSMGPQAKDSASHLIGLLRERTLDREGYPMADRAAAALGQVNPEARAVAVQQYLKELQDPAADRAAAAYALGRLRGAAKPAVPILLKLRKDKDQNVAKEVHNALEAIDPTAVDP